jgi:hypothetical protein
MEEMKTQSLANFATFSLPKLTTTYYLSHKQHFFYTFLHTEVEQEGRLNITMKSTLIECKYHLKCWRNWCDTIEYTTITENMRPVKENG